MKLLGISAVTLLIKDMNKSCRFYSTVPGFTVSYSSDRFTTFTLNQNTDKKIHLNLELELNNNIDGNQVKDFGRIIFHTDNVDDLYSYLKSDVIISNLITIETEPKDALWGERYFHIRDPDGYQISFAEPIK
ncbi:MAG: VOC family protein [Nitrosopumilus sp.]|nr:VOC family protein [Nitrosopumilus sp.]